MLSSCVYTFADEISAEILMPQPKTILLAEDDENDVILIQRAFAEAGVSEPIQVGAMARKRWLTSVVMESLRTATGTLFPACCCWIWRWAAGAD
jgi:hypothetical protein